LASAPVDIKQQERKKGSAGKLTRQKPAKNTAGSYGSEAAARQADDWPKMVTEFHAGTARLY
jgi:hypothetical protein